MDKRRLTGDREQTALAQGARIVPVGINSWALVDQEDHEWAQGLVWNLSGGRSGRYAVARGHGGLMHRLILGRMVGRELMSGELTDHLNGDRGDNRRENLRAVNWSGNSRNRHQVGAKLIGIAKGSRRDGSVFWRARLQARNAGRKVLLWSRNFPTVELAVAGYNAAAEAHGFLTRNKL